MNSRQRIWLRSTAVGAEVQRESGGRWERFYDTVIGLKVRPGRLYELDIDVIDVPDPPADGSSLRYELVAVRSDEAIPSIH